VARYFRSPEQGGWEAPRQECAAYATHHNVNLTPYELALLTDEVEGAVLHPEGEVVMWRILARMIEECRVIFVKIYLSKTHRYGDELADKLQSLRVAHPHNASYASSIELLDLMDDLAAAADEVLYHEAVVARANRYLQESRDLVAALMHNPHMKIMEPDRRSKFLEFSEEQIVGLDIACDTVEYYLDLLQGPGGEKLQALYMQLRSAEHHVLRRAYVDLPPELLRPLINPTDSQTSRQALIKRIEALDRFNLLLNAEEAEEPGDLPIAA